MPHLYNKPERTSIVTVQTAIKRWRWGSGSRAYSPVYFQKGSVLWCKNGRAKAAEEGDVCFVMRGPDIDE